MQSKYFLLQYTSVVVISVLKENLTILFEMKVEVAAHTVKIAYSYGLSVVFFYDIFARVWRLGEPGKTTGCQL